MAFAKSFNAIKLGKFEHIDSATGEVRNFKSLVFISNDGDKTFVGFSSKLGELSPSEITSMKHDLQVVQLESGAYKLCKQGNPGDAWEDVEL